MKQTKREIVENFETVSMKYEKSFKSDEIVENVLEIVKMFKIVESDYIQSAGRHNKIRGIWYENPV